MFHFTPSIRVALFAGAALAALQAAPAIAQDRTEEGPQAAAVDGTEIIVTARRREERLLDVPAAVTAFSGDMLESAGAIDITDIAQVTPNVTLEPSRGTNSTLTAFIRGVGQQDPVPGFEAGVGIYLDDVYLNRPQAAVLDIYDVERVEVLRGPQGTLYGRNTIGGAVKYVTRRLPDHFELRMRGTYGSYDQADGVVSVSTPIGGMFRVGGSVARLSRGGFGENLTLGIDNYNKDIWAGRGTIEFESPDGGLFIRFSGDYTDDESNARNGHRLTTGLYSGAPVLDNVYDTRAGLANPDNDVEAGGLAINATAHLNDNLTLRSISAWRKDRSYTPIDFDSLPSVDVDVPAVYRNEQISQEFQLLYESDRLNGMVGFYYLDAEASTAFDVILGTTGTLLSLPGLNAYTAGDVRTRTWSVFGDFTYDFTNQISLSIGGRFTNDVRRSTILKQTKIGGASPEFGGAAFPIATATDFMGEATFRKFTPRASLSYAPNRDLMFYASYAQGFKGGGFDPRGSATSAPDTNHDNVRSYQEIYDFLRFEPEEVESYEIGVKGSLFDRAVTFALSGFYADYTNVQVPGSVGIDANNDGIYESFAGVTTNAGKAHFAGIELETTARFARGFAGPGSSMTFNGTLGWIKAEYDEFIGSTGVDVADYRTIQNTPEWTLSGTYGASLPVGAGTLDFSTTLSYRSETHQFETPSPFLDQPGYALWDANLLYRFGSEERFSVGLHARNITDQRYITSGYQFAAGDAVTGQPTITGSGNIVPSLGLEGVETAFYGNPRQVFVSFSARF